MDLVQMKKDLLWVASQQIFEYLSQALKFLLTECLFLLGYNSFQLSFQLLICSFQEVYLISMIFLISNLEFNNDIFNTTQSSYSQNYSFFWLFERVHIPFVLQHASRSFHKSVSNRTPLFPIQPYLLPVLKFLFPCQFFPERWGLIILMTIDIAVYQILW